MIVLIALALALAPVGAIIIYFYSRDKFDREPMALLIRAFVLGLLSVFPALAGSAFGSYLGFEISPNIYITFIYAFFVVALSEELSKYLFLRYGLFPKPAFNEPYDGILYSVMVGMGFAAFENILYVLEGGVSLALLRMFTAVPAHATFGAIMGYYVGKAKFEPKHQTELLAKGLCIAVFMHGLYDFLLMQLIYEGMALGAIASLIISIGYAKKAVKLQQENSPFNPKNQTAAVQPATQGVEKNHGQGLITADTLEKTRAAGVENERIMPPTAPDPQRIVPIPIERSTLPLVAPVVIPKKNTANEDIPNNEIIKAAPDIEEINADNNHRHDDIVGNLSIDQPDSGDNAIKLTNYDDIFQENNLHIPPNDLSE